jgi:hypothetical protein
MIRMLIVGYGFGIRSERRLCEEVHLNLAYRWFCRLGPDADVSDHSTFSKNRHGRFRNSDLLRKLFETVAARCMEEGIVGGEAFAVDASMIVADAHRRRGVAKVFDASAFLLEKIGGFDVFVIAASLVLLNPDPDQARADVVSFREPMKGACGA